MLVHIFGATDSPCFANFVVKGVARDNKERCNRAASESILKSFYADDLLKSVISTEEAVNLAKEISDVMRRGGFRLTNFISNDKDTMDSIPVAERAKSFQTASFDGDINERTLGVKGNVTKDVFTFDTVKVKEEDVTKRNILKTVASIFDPVGFVAPFLVTGKIFLQELWRLKIDWDDRITKSQYKQWEKWKGELVNLKGVTIPRCHHLSRYLAKDIQLHVFCDASDLAYGAVAYLRFKFELEKPRCSFVISKSRFTPIKTISLPRLELNAAVLGGRLYTMIIKEINLPIQNVLLWTDSTLVLQYLKNQRHRFKVYVAN